MTSLVFRRLLTVSCLSASFLAAPSDSQAACALFEKLFGTGTPTTANYCAQPVVANYVPYTSYRPEVVNVPVTTCRPVCSVDPCTGCPTTVMMPATAMMQTTRMVPYTSYRLQYAAARPACATCPTTTAAYAPAPCSTCAAPTSSCSTCASGYATQATYAAPVTTMMAPASPACSSCNANANVAPSLSAAPMMSGPSMSGSSVTFAPGEVSTSGYRPDDISPGYQYQTQQYQTQTYYPPVDSTIVPGPVTVTNSNSIHNPTPTPAPPHQPEQTGGEKTFDNGSSSQGTSPQPIPKTESDAPTGSSSSSTSSPMSLPRIIDPENKTTMLPGRQAWAATNSAAFASRPVTAKLSTIEPATTTQPAAGGVQWRASNR